jgi:vitamin B12 transporter
MSFALSFSHLSACHRASATKDIRKMGAILKIHKSVFPLCGAIAAAMTSLPVQAQQTGAEVQLPTIVVSPTSLPTPVSEIGSSITIITAEDIQREQWRTVPDALRTVPGLNVVQTGGPGGQTSIFIRGTNSNQVKVLIDGIDARDPSVVNGAFDFAHLLTGDIAQIEVLRGPQSGLYGSDAIGGVVYITTKKGEGPPKVTATVEGGSFATFNQAAGVSGSQERFNYAFNVMHYHAGSVPVTPLELLAPGEKRNNDHYDNWTYSTRLGVDVSDDLAVNLIGRYIDAKHGLTADDGVNFPPNSAPEVLQDTQRNRQLYTRGEAVWTPFGDRFKNFFGINYTNQWLSFLDPNPDSFNPFGSVAPPTASLGQRWKYDWRGETIVAPGQKLVLGLEDDTESLRTNSTATADGVQTTTAAKQNNKAGWVELQSDFTHRIFLVANARYDDNESFGPHTTWRIAPAIIVPDLETKLKASYGTGFKAPTLGELFINNPSIGQVANPNLLPETSKGYDFGFEQPLLNGRFNFGATYFHNDITDLIVSQFNSDGGIFTSQFVNIGRARTEGVESFAFAIITDQVKVRADYTATFTRDELTGLGLPRRPANKVTLTTIWTPREDLTLTTTLLYVSSWVDVNRDTAIFIPRLDAPPYATVNIAANYQVDKHVSIFARADNLFNAQYQEPFGFLRPGLGVYGGVRVTN